MSVHNLITLDSLQSILARSVVLGSQQQHLVQSARGILNEGLLVTRVVLLHGHFHLVHDQVIICGRVETYLWCSTRVRLSYFCEC